MNDDKSNKSVTDSRGDSTETDATVNREPAKNSSNDQSNEHQTNVVVSSDTADTVAKQQGRSSAPVKPGAYSASNIRRSGETVNPQISNFEADILAKQRVGSSQASTLEQDVAAKQKGRQAAPAALADAVKPGAYSSSAISSSDGISPALRGAEADILAKQRAGAFKAVSSNLEQDIAAKQQGRPTNTASSAPGAYNLSSNPSKSNVNPMLRNIEADILAKQKAGASHPKAPPANTDATSQQLTDSLPATPGAYSSDSTDSNIALRDLETAIRTKQGHIHAKANIETPRHNDDCNAKMQAGTSTGLNSVELKVWGDEKQSMKSDNAATKRQNENRALNVDLSTKESFESPSKQTRGVVNSSTFSGAVDSNTMNVSDIGNKSKKDEQTLSALQQGNLNDLEYGEYGGEEAEGLAVAFAVEEVETDTYLPSAVEFDPDTKPPMYRNRRFRLYVCLMLAAAIVGTLGAALGIVLTAQESVPSESLPYRATLGIRENLSRIVSLEKLDDFSSPYKKALDWITFNDPMALTPDSSRFLNRYVLAYLYYATSQKKPWTSNCAPSESESENCIDVFLRDAVEEISVNKTSIKWFTNTDECEWAGVFCDGFNQIRSIELSDIGMSGTFPEGLALLPYLEEIDFRYSELTGPLPADLAKWKSLVDIGFKHCAFTGTIPDLWFESRAWTHIHLEDNFITGTLPSGITKFEDMKDLALSNNKMNGTLIADIGNMVNLQFLELDSNQLKGTIPRTVGKLSRLLSLDFSRNFLTGTIPEDIGGCAALVDLYLYKNLLTGPLPQAFWDLTALNYIQIGGNMLTGTISNRLSKFVDLREFEIENNQFNGSFPFRLGNTDVWTIRAYGNKFDGNVSTELCKLVDDGQIDDLEFDCATPIGGGTPEIFCPDDCCTVCCNSNGEDCVKM